MHCLQNVLFGMDILAYDDARISGDFSILDGSSSDEIPLDDYYSEVSRGNFLLFFSKQI